MSRVEKLIITSIGEYEYGRHLAYLSLSKKYLNPYRTSFPGRGLSLKTVNMGKHVESRTEHRAKGIRTVVGTFVKDNPQSIYWDCTISIDGTKDIDAMIDASNDIDDYLTNWIRYEQDDYNKKRYVKLVTYPEESKHSTYVAKTRRLHFELTLLHNNPQTWASAVEIADKHLDKIDAAIERIIARNGLNLQAFKGYNTKQ